jgi:hypothetical protein
MRVGLFFFFAVFIASMVLVCVVWRRSSVVVLVCLPISKCVLSLGYGVGSSENWVGCEELGE